MVVLLLDALHDVDVGVPAEESEKKLVNLGFAANLFAHSEKSKSKTARTVRSVSNLLDPFSDASLQFARRANLLIKALLDTKEARRQTRGSGTTRDYREVLKVSSHQKRSGQAELTGSCRILPKQSRARLQKVPSQFPPLDQEQVAGQTASRRRRAK